MTSRALVPVRRELAPVDMRPIDPDRARFFAEAWRNSFGQTRRDLTPEMVSGIEQKFRLAESGAHWDHSAPVYRQGGFVRGLPDVEPPAPPEAAPVLFLPAPRRPWWRRCLDWLLRR
jgi:hypothetical protein